MNLFNDRESIEEKLHGLIRIGEVCDIDYATGTARVVFDDDDSLVSNFLQVIQRNTYDNQDYAMPDLGEDVVCIFLSSGLEEGFILGSVYAGEITPKESSGDVRSVIFSDNTKISYNRATHELKVTINGTSIKATQENVEVVTPNNANVTAANIVANASSKASVKAPAVSIEGEVTINGNVSIQGEVTTSSTITASGDVIGAGKSLSTHTHTGNMGSPTSPPL